MKMQAGMLTQKRCGPNNRRYQTADWIFLFEFNEKKLLDSALSSTPFQDVLENLKWTMRSTCLMICLAPENLSFYYGHRQLRLTCLYTFLLSLTKEYIHILLLYIPKSEYS
ncbi:uncharacterized protein LOC132599773 [Lycium barbarum]|uniref:uncharacterized protein LOC132599773 n=1 Tax=Lycium barbarum TaxID=112863 RepID=UPI00293F6FC6|nr:uncharacterized protein LOC132599773 [Lycium barbarum]